MILIRCKNCGQAVSDKANVCPHCGSPVVLGNNSQEQPVYNPNEETEMESYGSNTSEPVVYYEDEKPESKNNTALLTGIALGLLALLIAGGWFWYDSEQKRAELERQLAEQAEQARQDSIAAAELREQFRQDSIAKAEQEQLIENSRQSYINILKGYLNKYGVDEYGSTGYFLFDITRDGMPELWVTAGTCEADYMLYIYTIKDGGASKIYEGGSSHSGYYRGKDYILQWWAHMGSSQMDRITYNGTRIKSITVYSEENIESSDDYTEPSEPEIVFNRINDYSPIYKMIK